MKIGSSIILSTSRLTTFIFLTVVTVIMFTFKPNYPLKMNSSSVLDDLILLDTGITFLNIFFNNFVVGILIVYIGFFSVGFFSIFIWSWNTLVVFLLYFDFISSPSVDYNLVVFSAKHFPFELYAFILFTKLNISGYKFYKKIIVNNDFDEKLIPTFNQIIYPTLILFISSIIETF